MAMKEIFFQLTEMCTIVLYYCFFQTYLPDLYFMKIAVSLIHFLMCLLGVFQIISGSEFHTAISFPLVIGYGCSGFSLMSIGGQIFKSITIVTNTVFVVFSMIGLVYFAIISPISGGVFDTVALMGCIIIGVVGGFTIKLLKKSPSKD